MTREGARFQSSQERWNNEVELMPVHPLINNDLMTQIVTMEENLFEFPWSIHDFEKSLRLGSRVYAIIVKGTRNVIAYVVWSGINHGPGTAKIGYVSNLGVDSEFQRQGLGLWVLAQVLNKMVYFNYKEARAVVRETNLAAQKLLQDAGFLAVGLKEATWTVPEDGPPDEKVIRFVRTLPPRKD